MKYANVFGLLIILSLAIFACNNNDINDGIPPQKEQKEAAKVRKNETLPISKENVEQLIDLEIASIDDWSVNVIDAEDLSEAETVTHYLHVSITRKDGKQAIARMTGVLQAGIWTPQATTDAINGESCTGDPCSHCKFAHGGGCDCISSNINDKCNHKITKD